MNTAPVIFGTEKPKMLSTMIQTEPLVNEYGIPDEPIAVYRAHEPETNKINVIHGTATLISEAEPG